MESKHHQNQENNVNSKSHIKTPLPQEESSLLAAILSQFDSSAEKPYPLLVLNLQANQFHLSLAAKSSLSSLKGECYVISISGNPLIGKSSLLNLLVSFFKNQETDAFKASQGSISFRDVYAIGDGRRSTTEGIDMFCITIQGKNFIFLDVEGDNDPSRKETGVWIYTNLIQTALGVSHIHIYNYHGIPQETFLNYFKTIHKIAHQDKLHPEFNTKLLFLKRNHLIPSGCSHSQELVEIRSCFDHERLENTGLDYSLYYLPTPPKHITDRKSPSSCLTSTGALCEGCQKDLFVTILSEIHNELNSHLKHVIPFKDGKDFLKTLEQIMKINAQKIPFFLDLGHISKIRSDNLKKEQLRIQDGLLKAEQFKFQRGISKELERIMVDHPKLAKVEYAEQFETAEVTLARKISQINYMMPELNRFMEGYLLDNNSSILDEKEKETLFEIYVTPFYKLTDEILGAFEFYEKVIDSICTNLEEVKQDTETGLKNYMKACDATTIRTLISIASFTSSGTAVFVAREAVVAVIATGCTGGAVAAGLAVLSLVQAKRKWNETKKKNEEHLDTTRIPGIDSKKQAENELKKIEEFVTMLFQGLRKSSASIREICSEKENVNMTLVKKIKEVMENKLKGIPLTVESELRLKELRKAAEVNIERFQDSL